MNESKLGFSVACYVQNIEITNTRLMLQPLQTLTRPKTNFFPRISRINEVFFRKDLFSQMRVQFAKISPFKENILAGRDSIIVSL